MEVTPIQASTNNETKLLAMNEYTVTATATYFVTASDATDAMTKVYEAMLGNDDERILGWGEVHQATMHVQHGTHYTINHGNN